MTGLPNRAWRLAFLGLFVPLALPPLALIVVPRGAPTAVGALLWLWGDFFWLDVFDKVPSPLGLWAAAFAYTLLAAAFAFLCAWVEGRLRK